MNLRLLTLNFVCVSLLCSCATQRIAHNGLPGDIVMDMDAGRDGLLIVPVRLENGEDLPFVVDTGSPYTLFDKSFESKLGKRMGSGVATNFDLRYEMGFYAAPKISLAGAPLKIDGDSVGTIDLSRLSTNADRSIMGLIGMDCLSRYCIQLDFKKGKMRFLNPEQVNPAKLGKAYPVEFSGEGQSGGAFCPVIRYGSLVGDEGTHVMIDTGCNIDGGLQPQLFQKEVKALKHEMTDDGGANFPGFCTWDARTYTNITVRTWTNDLAEPNLIGLRFLSRHLVTLDFPHHTLYLQQTRVGPLSRDDLEAALNATKMSAAMGAFKFCRRLMEKSELPGWSKKDVPASNKADFDYQYPDSVVFKARKKGDPSLYRYQLLRATEHSPWKLHRAWRTDKDGKGIEEFPVP